MSDRFPLRPNSDWHAALVARHGDAVPAIERLQIRRGLQSAVGDMYEKLYGLGLIDKVDILSVVTRDAAFVVIDARYHGGLYEDDRIALDFLFHGAAGDLNETCEHCGRLGEIVAKTGLEALLDDQDAALGDRFLCAECYESWSGRRDD